MDQDHRVFSRRSAPPISISPYALGTNIRNTKQIAQVFGSLATERIQLRSLEGPPVLFAPSDTAMATDVADAVDALLDEWPPGRLALLTTKHRHNLQQEVVDGQGWSAYWDAFFAQEEVFYGHVLGCKGLERAVLVLAVEGLKQPERASEMLYVGLSRARTLLVVCGDLEEIAAVGGESVRRRLQAANRWTP